MPCGKKILVISILMLLFLTACGKAADFSGENLGSNPSQTNSKATITLVLAVFDENETVKKQVAKFNEENEVYQIEIKKYQRSEVPEEDGLLLLQREIASGKGPDIIDFGCDYSTSDIVGEYTEDLRPYFAREDKEAYFQNVMQAFSYRDKFYAMPISFTMKTFAGSREALDGREHWNIEEMMDCYLQKEADMLLYPGQTKKDVFGTILSGSLEYYVDWEKGTCRFDGEEFEDLLQFCNLFPEALRIMDDFSVKQTFLNGKALLLPMHLRDAFDICRADHIFGEEEISYIGFPVKGICGTMITPGNVVLAIVSDSACKDAAWQFVYSFFSEEFQREIKAGFPVCKSALEQELKEAQMPECTTDAEGTQVPRAKAQVLFEGEEPIEIYTLNKEQAEALRNLIEKAQLSTSTDHKLYGILLEEADAYFSGQKTLKDTVQIIQSRASVYVGERVK